MNNKPCYCGSNKCFSRCCQPLLTGADSAQTAEQLMRSRYSAFCDGNVGYLISTLHSSQRQAQDHLQLSLQLQQSIDQNQWLKLTILGSKNGLSNDSQGEVEFIACSRQQGQVQFLRENSRFIKEQGRWLYVDGDII